MYQQKAMEPAFPICLNTEYQQSLSEEADTQSKTLQGINPFLKFKRCWAYETSLVLGKQLDNELPKDLEYADAYREDPVLHFTKLKTENEEQNDSQYLNSMLQKAYEHLKKIDFAPNIGGMEVPTDYKLREEGEWQDGNDPKILDQFIFKEKGVSHLEMTEEDKERSSKN